MGNIIINGKWILQSRPTGVQRYADGLLDALGRAGLRYELARPSRTAALATTLWEQLCLPRLARPGDTLLCPANMAPLGFTTGVHLVVTIHCLRFLSHPENYSRTFAGWYRLAIPRIIRRADVVLAVSQTTAREIEHAYPHARGKVAVVQPGVADAFSPLGPAGDAAIGQEPYWLFMGNAAPAKNLQTLIRAVSLARLPHRIVVTGVEPRSLDRLGAGRAKGRLLALGHVNDLCRLAAIYRGALGLLAPSVYESFDLPTVEAMACGLAVLASDIPVHREICGGAAVFLPPCRPEAWAGAMDELSSDPQSLRRLARVGIERRRLFDWDRAARQVIAVLDQPRAHVA